MSVTYQGKQPYLLESVEKIDAPDGLPGNNWHRYIIKRGESVIKGTKTGTLESVTAHAQKAADDMNLRAQNGGSYYAPTHRQNKNKKE